VLSGCTMCQSACMLGYCDKVVAHCVGTVPDKAGALCRGGGALFVHVVPCVVLLNRSGVLCCCI
jgi:hypothetical protein